MLRQGETGNARDANLYDSLHNTNQKTKTPSTVENQSVRNNISFVSHEQNIAELANSSSFN